MSLSKHPKMPATIGTIGHSTRSIQEFLCLPAAVRIQAIADALCVRGIELVHILDAEHSMLHLMTAPPRIVRGELI